MGNLTYTVENDSFGDRIHIAAGELHIGTIWGHIGESPAQSSASFDKEHNIIYIYSEPAKLAAVIWGIKPKESNNA